MILLGTSKMAFIRYVVPLMPFISLFTAVGFITVYNIMFTKNKHVALLLSSFLFILVIFTPLRTVFGQNLLLTKEDSRITAKRWIEENIPADSKIALQWFTPTLSTKENPEPGSTRTFEAIILDPFTSNPDYYSLDYYITNKFQYIVISSYIYGLRRVDDFEEATRQDFYASLLDNAELLAEFNPYKANLDPPFYFEEIYGPVISLRSRDRPGPVIKVYRIERISEEAHHVQW
jgi:hypothetical protein